MRTTPSLATAILAVLTIGGAGHAEDVTADTLTDEHVLAAIDAIVEELYARKDTSTFWEPPRLPAGESRQDGGYTALTVLSLLYAGESFQDPRLRGAVDYLTEVGIDGTYAISLRTNVWARLPPKFQEELLADTQWLLEGFSERVGGWTYRQEPNTTRRDNSINQYGALALWESAKRGVNIDSRFWRMLEEGFLDMQLADGSWNYTGDGAGTGSMTAAGLATLFITQDYLHAEAFLDLRRPGAAADPHETAIARGLEWMGEHFSPEDNPGSFRDYYYYMYGVERVGLASGLKYFGAHDWFREGAAELIRRLCAWDEEERRMIVHQRIGGDGRAGEVRVRHLTFGLMFLSRGRVPVAFNKLALDDMAWNNRPRDAANVARWISDTTETALSWQIVDFDREPESWLDAPVLYLASNERLPWLASVDVEADAWAEEQRSWRRQRASGEIPFDAPPARSVDVPELERLRRYLDLGGLLLAVDEGGERRFAESIVRAGTLLYPAAEWRRLPDDHWAYTLVYPVQGRVPALRGLTNGVRELIIVADAPDLARVFQQRDEESEAYATVANLYLYASEMNRPRPRLARHVVTAGGESGGPAVVVARAWHDAAGPPEPLALEAFADAMSGAGRFDLTIVDTPLSDIHEVSPAPTLVVSSGTSEHVFTAAEIEAVRTYVANGGTVLFESAGGRGVYAIDAERMASTAFELPIRSATRTPIVTGEGLPGGDRLSRVDYRPYAHVVFGARETTPRLRALRVGDRFAVLFSRDDLSHALLDQPRWGISGYAPDSARRLLANVIEFAIGP